jgi:hypothetical protein
MEENNSAAVKNTSLSLENWGRATFCPIKKPQI